MGRIMLISFFVIASSLCYYLELYIGSHYMTFWLGFVVSAIAFKEIKVLERWVKGKGIDPEMFIKNDEKQNPK